MYIQYRDATGGSIRQPETVEPSGIHLWSWGNVSSDSDLLYRTRKDQG